VAFLPLIGHHGKLLVYDFGRYQSADFVKTGATLLVICGWFVVLLVPLI
jgi:di/tricarboxylate transporter